MHLKKSDLEKFYRKLLSASWEVFSWKWDHRFEAFLTEFSADNGDEFRAILERDFINVWDSSNIREALDIVQMCNNNFGGLRPGQLLFTTRAKMFLFAAPGGRGAMEKLSLFASHRPPRNYSMKKDRTLQTAQKFIRTMNRKTTAEESRNASSAGLHLRTFFSNSLTLCSSSL